MKEFFFFFLQGKKNKKKKRTGKGRSWLASSEVGFPSIIPNKR